MVLLQLLLAVRRQFACRVTLGCNPMCKRVVLVFVPLEGLVQVSCWPRLLQVGLSSNPQPQTVNPKGEGGCFLPLS